MFGHDRRWLPTWRTRRAVALRGGREQLRLERVVAARLLDVDVLAGREGQHGRRGVPVVRRGDDDAVDILLREHPADVLLGLRRVGLIRRDRFHPLGQGLFLGIANEPDLDAGHAAEHLRVLGAPAVGADDGEDDAIVGALGLQARRPGDAEPDGGSRRRLDERPP